MAQLLLCFPYSCISNVTFKTKTKGAIQHLLPFILRGDKSMVKENGK
ncbi:hypothetical protein BTN50_1201 [Candidatus Enterovibrio altilux]|uniref:Uncharacterized protein n=1 Tax=Candidatus Enterovibrio altilux TaxID=1927128 RepID=A0A291B9N2_9GAMM|nr:hypothetical protein BTN50_1201 [Candidatus Enterovibrio luxaltus]